MLIEIKEGSSCGYKQGPRYAATEITGIYRTCKETPESDIILVEMETDTSQKPTSYLYRIFPVPYRGDATPVTMSVNQCLRTRMSQNVINMGAPGTRKGHNRPKHPQCQHNAVSNRAFRQL
jgi:hypothetical protein